MTDTPPLDADTPASAGRVFDLARTGGAAELDELLVHGASANLTNAKGDTLLILAAYHGHLDTVRVLLDRGADPERANARGQTALAAAAFKGALAVMELLLERGACVDGAGPDGRTALMVAAMFDRSDPLDLLLAHGADPACTDAGGHDAASLATQMRAYGTPRRLVAAMSRKGS